MIRCQHSLVYQDHHSSCYAVQYNKVCYTSPQRLMKKDRSSIDSEETSLLHVYRLHKRIVGVKVTLYTSTMQLSHIPQCTVQNRNVHISVLNGTFWDIEQVHCGICKIGLLKRKSGLVSQYNNKNRKCTHHSDAGVEIDYNLNCQQTPNPSPVRAMHGLVCYKFKFSVEII